MGAMWLSEKSRRRTLMNLREREFLDDAAVYSRYYADSGIPEPRVLELWHEVANALSVSPGLLRPEDRFGKDIGVGFITSEDLDYLSQLAMKRAKVDARNVDLQSIRTVDDYVRALA